MCWYYNVYMALPEVAPESTIGEQMRVSAGCLCSIVIDGKYLLISETDPTVEANELGEYPLKPIGGAYESHDSGYWDAVGLHLASGTNDIRGFIPNNPGAREAFSQAFRLRRGRNADPQVEFDQELKPLLEPFLDGPLEQSDVEFRYRTTEKDDSPSSRADAINIPTFHTYEIFDVTMSERVKDAMRKAVNAGSGLALLTEQQLHGAMVSNDQILVGLNGEERRCYVAPHARYLIQPRTHTYPESHNFDMNRSTAYRLA